MTSNPWRDYLRLLPPLALDLRASAAPVALGGLALPVGLTLALRGANLAQTLPQRELAVGAAGVVALLTVALLFVPPAAAKLRAGGQISYFATLPIGRWPLLAALMTIYGALALPGMLLGPLVAGRVFGVRLALAPPSVVLALVAMALFLGLGLAAGFGARGERAASLLGVVLFVALLGGVPALIAPPTLPHPLLAALALLPGAVTIDVFTQGLRGAAPDWPLEAVLLLSYAALAGAAADRLLPWRAGQRRSLFSPWRTS